MLDDRPPVEHVLESAIGVAKGVYAPMYKRQNYEGAMLDIAKREARNGESTAVSFARLCEERDHRVESLYVAGRRAEYEEARKAEEQRREAIASGRLQEEVRSWSVGRWMPEAHADLPGALVGGGGRVGGDGAGRGCGWRAWGW